MLHAEGAPTFVIDMVPRLPNDAVNVFRRPNVAAYRLFAVPKRRVRVRLATAVRNPADPQNASGERIKHALVYEAIDNSGA